jgi:hypothetical protein
MNVRPKAENERSEWVNGGAKHRNELTELGEAQWDVFGVWEIDDENEE